MARQRNGERWTVIAFVPAVALLGVIGLLALVPKIHDEDAAKREVISQIALVSAESASVTDQYLGAAESSASVLGRLAFAGESPTAAEFTFELWSVFSVHAHLDGAFFGFPDGEFIYVSRAAHDEDISFRVKYIEIDDNGNRQVNLATTNDSFEIIDVQVDNTDTYDPTKRSWYVSAEANAGPVWTDPYIFFDSQNPGITHARPLYGDDGELFAVVGIDLRLAELAGFLEQRAPSVNGAAFVVNERGKVIAGSESTVRSPLSAEDARDAWDVDTDGGWTRWQDDGDGPIAVSIQQVSSTAPWQLVVSAPETDFLAELRAEAQRLTTAFMLAGLIGSLFLLLLTARLAARVRSLRNAATSDAMTGLANRESIRNELEAVLGDHRNRAVGVMIIDIDKFKTINDTHGHLAGDRVLLEAAARLKERVGHRATIGRLGGDELIVVMTADSPTEIETVAHEVHTDLVAPIDAGQVTIDVGFSIGVTVKQPHESKGPGVMLREADVALYASKNQRSGVTRFVEALSLPSARSRDRARELTQAIHGGQFELCFQPEVSLSDRSIVGAEALLRWNHPERGFLPAAEFVDDLEQLQLLSELLPQLIRDAAAFAQHQPSPFMIRVNVAAAQLLDPRLVALVQSAMQQTPNASWCLEITERSVMEVATRARQTLETLREMGVTIALDDFGTGYSSLAELQNLPVDSIKIDRTFVNDLTHAGKDRGIAGTILGLGFRLGLDVVAEGIETETQLDILRSLGCSRGQGYLFAPAVKPTDALWSAGVLTTTTDYEPAPA
jgi:diguanylate cyclase (GGDEF)-like protein